MTLAIIHTDGGARGNPGPAGIGAVVRIGEVEHLLKRYIGETTNNQAEYQALIMALEDALKLGATEADCYLDSLLVVKQVNREYKVKDLELSKQIIKVWALAQKFKRITFNHIRREENKLADKLVNEVLDERIK